ncbi:MAG: arginine--tRNA ligase [Bacteroidales bacterium]|nr:arginine--tRNA ligase [Bacteroidales bacterium]
MEKQILDKVKQLVRELYDIEAAGKQLLLQKTLPDFEGDYTVVVFPFTKAVGKPPHVIGEEIGIRLKESMDIIASYNVVKGFLNLSLKNEVWLGVLKRNYDNKDYGLHDIIDEQPVVIEFSSPNTNKPLHLGHVRNNLLGESVARILKAAGKNVKKVNLINDRGIHICKSMLAWQKWGKGESPESSGLKGDQLVGKYYVMFDQELKKEKEKLAKQGVSEDELDNESILMQEAREMLRLWEKRDKEVMQLWSKMNNWVYGGFHETYDRMGISFDKIYYESDTYLEGKKMVLDALDKGILIQKDDGSVWADLRKHNLDEKILLRKDGTSVYMTQDLGTAQLRFRDFDPSEMLYVVGNEQDYHFNVLQIVLREMGYSWAELIKHLSYGMVELPHGKMKSREGTVVDADDLMDEMYDTAKAMTKELGKIDDLQSNEAKNLFNMVSLGALKYFILKVDPKKNMMFKPEESINFNGNTAPFIQYTHARIKSLLRKANCTNLEFEDVDPSFMMDSEREILKKLALYPSAISEAAEEKSPSVIASYSFELVKLYNQFYQDVPVLKEKERSVIDFRLAMSLFVGHVVRSSMTLLGIDVPDKM